MDLFQELLKIAAHGPTGLVRNAVGALIRADEEHQELLAATTRVAVAEEAGDVMYYLTIANHNDNIVLSDEALQANLERLAHHTGLSEEMILKCAIAKFHTRFIVNSRRKDRAAEWRAIQEALSSNE